MSKLQLPAPYLILLGDVDCKTLAKTALGIAHWAPEKCIGQYRFPGCPIDLGLSDKSISEAVQAGAKSLLIGIAPIGGAVQKNWIPILIQAMEAGLHVISGLHSRLSDHPELSMVANKHSVSLIDIRVPPKDLPIGNGTKRSGLRLLTVGTDCSVGKKFTALAIAKSLKSKGLKCDFRASGQTGIMIAGEGLPIDAIVSDFLAGAAETLSPDNDDDHWDVVEGQGSLFSPAYGGVSLGLLQGTQPDVIVVCHDPARDSILGCPQQSISSIQECIDINLRLAKLVNPSVRCGGVSLNTSTVSQEVRRDLIHSLSMDTGLPIVDSVIDSIEPIVQKALSIVSDDSC